VDPVRRFAEACGAQFPVDLRIERSDGMPLAEGQLELPMAVIGSDPDGEISLLGDDVKLRHACLQVVGGRVLIAALGSGSKITGLASGTGFAWLTPTVSVGIGNFRFYLRQPVSISPIPLDRGFDPLQPAPVLLNGLPRTVIRFLNGRAAQSEWTVNRLMTFVGQGNECKICLNSSEIAEFHAYFLLTAAGLWIIDLLSPGGVQVNGQPVRFARLGPSDEVRIGRFAFGCHYPDGDPLGQTEFHSELFRHTEPVRPTAPPTPSVAAEISPGSTTLIRANMIEQFQQSIVEMLGSLGALPPAIILQVQQKLEGVSQLTTELQILEQQSLNLSSVSNAEISKLADRIASLRLERQELWRTLFRIIADAEENTII
jgi:hypothetical protein